MSSTAYGKIIEGNIVQCDTCDCFEKVSKKRAIEILKNRQLSGKSHMKKQNTTTKMPKNS